MPLKDAIIQAGTAIAVFAGIGYIIYSKMVKVKPQAAERIKGLFKDKNVPVPEGVKDKIEQVWDEKRTMM